MMGTTPSHLSFYQADVFSDVPYGGNPVAVFPDAPALSDQEFQRIAREMNLSETVFVRPPEQAGASLKVRIFTPTHELPFAGHPMLGTAYVLAVLNLIDVQEPVTRIHCECHIGVFPVDIVILGGVVERVMMSQPSPEFPEVIDVVDEVYTVARALGIRHSDIMHGTFPVEVASTGLPVMIVPVRSLTALRSAALDHTAITEVCGRYGANGIMAFCTMTVEDWAHVHTRMFGAPIGVYEDPATGSASGALGAYLVKNGVVEVGPTTEILMEQGYEIERPSRIVVQVFSDDDIIQSVTVGGRAVMVAEGKLYNRGA